MAKVVFSFIANTDILFLIGRSPQLNIGNLHLEVLIQQ